MKRFTLSNYLATSSHVHPFSLPLFLSFKKIEFSLSVDSQASEKIVNSRFSRRMDLLKYSIFSCIKDLMLLLNHGGLRHHEL